MSGRRKDRERRPVVEKEWADPASFDKFEGVRILSRPATAQVVTGVLSQHARDGRIVEIGCGLGELVFNVLPTESPFRTRIQQTEQSASLVAAHRQRHPDSNIRQADVYALPYAHGSVGTVIGFSSFDTFTNMPKAVAEIDRVLEVGGKVMHFLDIGASNDPFFQNYDPQKSKVIPVPTPPSHEDDARGYLMVPRSDFSTFIAQVRAYKPQEQFAKWLVQYARDPEAQLRYTSDPALVAGLKTASSYFRSHIPDIQTVTTLSYFSDRLEGALRHKGFSIDTVGKQEGVFFFEKPAAESGETGSSNNVFYHDLALADWKHDPEVPEDKVKSVAKVHVLVATKQAA